jgi:F0F1-type ATP synthase epsilon subunit
MSDQTNQPVQPATTQEPKPILDRIHVMVRNRRQVLFDDDVKALTSKNDTGVFDILPEHSNFISVMKEAITLHKLDGTEQVITLKNGLIKVKNSSVRCYIDLLTAEMAKMQQTPIK